MRPFELLLPLTLAGVALLATSVDVPLCAQETSQRVWLGDLSERQVVGEAGDPVFGLLSLIVAHPEGGFVVADLYYGQVRRFGAGGGERWSSGAIGDGPGEFRTISDLEISEDGGVIVLDPALGRITELSSQGEVRSTTRTPRPVRRLFPRFGASAWVVAPRDDRTLWLDVTDDGLLGDGFQSLPKEVSFTHTLAGEPFTTASDLGAVVVYRWSSKMVYLDEYGNVRGVEDGVEEIAFPDVKEYGTAGDIGQAARRVDPDATWAARSVSAFAGRVYVLFRGRGADDSHSVIDVYDEREMRYAGSFRVPSAADGIAVLANGHLATIENAFVPVVKIWRGLDHGSGS
ncbi:MAG: hypothetical protein WD960_01615 [Gemmatimonadota bacterium]